MAVRFFIARTLCLALVLGAAGLAPALAQQIDPPTPPGKQKKLPEATAKLPKVDRTKNLDFIISAVKAVPDEASAKLVEARIWAIWIQTPSYTAALLMTRAKTAVDAKKIEVAIKLLESVVQLRPHY